MPLVDEFWNILGWGFENILFYALLNGENNDTSELRCYEINGFTGLGNEFVLLFALSGWFELNIFIDAYWGEWKLFVLLFWTKLGNVDWIG